MSINIIGIINTLRTDASQKKNLLILKLKGIRYGSGLICHGHIRIWGRNITLGNNCKINGGWRYNPVGGSNETCLVSNENGKITIGDNVGISNAVIYSTVSVSIGNGTLIGAGVKIFDTDFHSTNPRYRGTAEDKEHTKSKPVVIDDHAFIGAEAIILKGVHIGKNAIVGAGSVVTRSIPNYQVWVGNPARFVKTVEN